MKALSDYRTSVKPDIASRRQDQSREDFGRALHFLIANYSVAELAGAYLNATSGDKWAAILELANRVEEP